MDPAIIARLETINREFYDAFAAEFSRSRSTLNPGILRAVEGLRPRSLLDLGCGDGRVGFAWLDGALPIAAPDDAVYVGVDRSAELLSARGPWPRAMHAVATDLADDWESALVQPQYDLVVCFAVLHHIPDRARRIAFLRRLGARVAPEGHWILSVWQVLHLDRFRRRVLPWSELGLDAGELEPGDLLMDWRRGGRGLRYVHQFDPNGLESEISEAGLVVEGSFRSDGRTGDLGLYYRGTVVNPK